MVGELTEYLELASEVGCSFVRILCTRELLPQGTVDDGAVVACLKEIASLAQVFDVCVLLESDSDYADTARLASVLDAVDSPYIAALWDTQHPYRIFGEDPATSIANLGRHLRYCQIKDSVMVDGRVQYRMMGEGDMPLVQMLDALQASGYEGYVSFEWPRRWAREVAKGEPGIVFPQFMNYMRDYLSASAGQVEAAVESVDTEEVASTAELTGELQTSISGKGTYPWPKEHLIDLTFPQVLDHVCELYPDQYAFRFTEFDYSRT